MANGTTMDGQPEQSFPAPPCLGESELLFSGSLFGRNVMFIAHISPLLIKSAVHALAAAVFTVGSRPYGDPAPFVRAGWRLWDWRYVERHCWPHHLPAVLALTLMLVHYNSRHRTLRRVTHRHSPAFLNISAAKSRACCGLKTMCPPRSFGLGSISGWLTITSRPSGVIPTSS